MARKTPAGKSPGVRLRKKSGDIAVMPAILKGNDGLEAFDA
jgi:hypothetical protein